MNEVYRQLHLWESYEEYTDNSFMPDNQNQPRKDDVVLGGQSPPPVQGVVLGGIEGVKRRLSSPVIEARVAALKDALNYGDAGLDLVIQALQDEPRQVQRSAYRLLRKREEPQVKQVLQKYKPWDLVERLEEYPGYKCKHVSRFANRQVAKFFLHSGIADPIGTAYALVDRELESLLQDPKAGELEALVFRGWSGIYHNGSKNLVDALVAAKNKLTSLKAVLIGDITFEECEISWIQQSDVSPILRAYPQLEVLQVRGGDGLAFSQPMRHDNLKALIVETAGLSRTTVAQICNLNLPALEHIELWFGTERYGGDCEIEDLTPILKEQKFPNLTYLGLRNSQFTDQIAEAIARSPLLKSISVLDLSMGTLSDEGAETLLHCFAVHELDILNVSENFLSYKMAQQLYQIKETIQRLYLPTLLKKLVSDVTVQVLVGKQKYEDDDDNYIDNRYCSVAE